MNSTLEHVRKTPGVRRNASGSAVADAPPGSFGSDVHSANPPAVATRFTRGWINRYVAGFAVVGFVVGLGFPIAATLIDSWSQFRSLSIRDLAAVHTRTALHLVIDTAPFILAGLAAAIGRERMRMTGLLARMDSMVRERTSRLEDTCEALEAESAEHRRVKLEFETIYEATPLGIVVVDAKGRITRWNEAFRALTGRGNDDLPHTYPTAMVHPDEREEVVFLWKEARSRRTRQTTEIRYLQSDSQEGTVRITAVPLPLEENGNLGLLAIVEDVTDRKRAEGEMQAMEVQLRHAQKLEAIGQLAAGIAHEINTPSQYVNDNVVFAARAFDGIEEVLATLDEVMESEAAKGSTLFEPLVEVMKRRKVGFLRTEVPLALGQSREGLERVRSIVAAMKEFSHPSQGKKQPLDLARTITSTIAVARNEWKYLADVETNFDPDLPEVLALREELNQVILNLVVNAAQAIGDREASSPAEKGIIRVSTRLRDPWVEVSVADNGCGIPAEILERIFDPFFTTKGVGRGTGQGLAIARSVVVDKHSGRIEVKSEVGKGSTFSVILPLDGGRTVIDAEAA